MRSSAWGHQLVDKPAVYVTNAGEPRSKTNVVLLENTSYSSKS